MFNRDEIKALTDKTLTMARDAKADGAEVSFDGGERSATRWANSSITTNLVQYYQYAEAGFILTCRMPSGSGSGWAGITGAKDLSQIDVAQLTEVASSKAVKSQKPRAIEPGRYTTILEPRPAARFLSTMMGAFNAGAPGGGFGGGGGGFNFGGIGRPFVNADGTPKIGQKLLSDAFTLKSD